MCLEIYLSSSYFQSLLKVGSNPIYTSFPGRFLIRSCPYYFYQPFFPFLGIINSDQLPLFLESDHLHIFGIEESVIYILDPSFIANVSFKLIIVQFKTQ